MPRWVDRQTSTLACPDTINSREVLKQNRHSYLLPMESKSGLVLWQLMGGSCITKEFPKLANYKCFVIKSPKVLGKFWIFKDSVNPAAQKL